MNLKFHLLITSSSLTYSSPPSHSPTHHLLLTDYHLPLTYLLITSYSPTHHLPLTHLLITTYSLSYLSPPTHYPTYQFPLTNLLITSQSLTYSLTYSSPPTHSASHHLPITHLLITSYSVVELWGIFHFAPGVLTNLALLREFLDKKVTTTQAMEERTQWVYKVYSHKTGSKT